MWPVDKRRPLLRRHGVIEKYAINVYTYYLFNARLWNMLYTRIEGPLEPLCTHNCANPINGLVNMSPRRFYRALSIENAFCEVVDFYDRRNIREIYSSRDRISVREMFESLCPLFRGVQEMLHTMGQRADKERSNMQIGLS